MQSRSNFSVFKSFEVRMWKNPDAVNNMCRIFLSTAIKQQPDTSFQYLHKNENDQLWQAYTYLFLRS